MWLITAPHPRVYPASRGTFRLPTFVDGSYPYDEPSLTAAISSSIPPEYTPASSAEDIASRDRLSAAIEALIAHGVQVHMSTSEASKALAKRKRFEQRNGIRGGLGG